MAHPLYHARASAHRYGGVAANYLAIHEFMDQTKAAIADCRHRMILHNTWGIGVAIAVLGERVTAASSGMEVPLRTLLEDHVREDLGRVPTLAECFPEGCGDALPGQAAGDSRQDLEPAAVHRHAVRSARRFGGDPEDYLALHAFLDGPKTELPDRRHRLPMHNAWGPFLAAQVFGSLMTRASDGKEVPVRAVAEEHIVADLGRIPTLAECLERMSLAAWMCRVALPLSRRFGEGYGR